MNKVTLFELVVLWIILLLVGCSNSGPPHPILIATPPLSKTTTITLLSEDCYLGWTSVKFSPDNQKLFASTCDKLFVWDTDTWDLLSETRQTLPNWSPDGKLLVIDDLAFDEETGHWNILKTVMQDAVTGTNLYVIGKFAAWHVGWSSDGTRFFVDNKMWDAQTGKVLYEIEESSRPLWAPNGQMVENQNIVWDTQTGKPLYELEKDAEEKHWSPDGTLIATNNMVRDAQTGKILYTIDQYRKETQLDQTSGMRRFKSDVLSWSQDGEMLILLLLGVEWEPEKLLVFNAKTGKLLHILPDINQPVTRSRTRIHYNYQSYISDKGFSPTGGKIFMAHELGGYHVSSNISHSCCGTLDLWDTQTGRKINISPLLSNDEDFSYISRDPLVFNSTDNLLAIGGSGNHGNEKTIVIDTITGERLWVLETSPRLSDIAWSKNKNILALGLERGTVILEILN